MFLIFCPSYPVLERYTVMHIRKGHSQMSVLNVSQRIKQAQIFPCKEESRCQPHLAVTPAFSILSTIFHFVDPFQVPGDNGFQSGQEMVCDKGIIVDSCANTVEEYSFIPILQTAAWKLQRW